MRSTRSSGPFERVLARGVGKVATVHAFAANHNERHDNSIRNLGCVPAGVVGVNIMTSQQAIFWKALRTAGIDDKIDGFGRLLREF